MCFVMGHHIVSVKGGRFKGNSKTILSSIVTVEQISDHTLGRSMVSRRYGLSCDASDGNLIVAPFHRHRTSSRVCCRGQADACETKSNG